MVGKIPNQKNKRKVRKVIFIESEEMESESKSENEEKMEYE